MNQSTGNKWNYKYQIIIETDLITQMGMKEKKKNTPEEQENFSKLNFTAKI